MNDLNDWCNSSSCWCHDYVQGGYDRILSFNGLATASTSKKTRWRMLWRKIMREKKRIFDCSSCIASSSARVRVPYDPYTYSQNFDDQAFLWADPDNVSRSFSARFAVPLRVFKKSELVA